MSSDEINQDEYAQDAQNKEMLLEIFYKTKGNIDDINAAIDKNCLLYTSPSPRDS